MLRKHLFHPGRWPDTVWLAIIGNVFLIRFPLLFLRTSPFPMDLDVFHGVARRILEGQNLLLYAPVGSAQAVFKYGPAWALAFAPLGWFSFHAASVLWSAFHVGCLLLTGWLGLKLCRAAGLSAPGWVFLAAIGLLVRPVTSEFLLGQTNLLWAALTAGFAYFHHRQRTIASAICLALAVSLKLPAAVFLPWLLLRGQWRTALWTAVAALVINLAAALLLCGTAALQLFADWAGVLAASGPERAFEIGNQSFLALLGRLLRADGYRLNLLSLSDVAVMRISAAAALAVFCLLFVQRSKQPAKKQAAAGLWDGALLTVLMVLFSPTTWVATYSALLWPVMLAVAALADEGRRLLRQPRLIVNGAVLLALSLMTHSKFWKAIGLRYFRGESYVYLVFLVLPAFALALLWLLWQQRQNRLRS